MFQLNFSLMLPNMMCRIYTDYTITPLSDDLDLSHMQRQKSNMENNIKNVLHHQICPGP